MKACVCLLVVGAWLGSTVSAGEGSYASALEALIGRCPKDYPEVVTPLPEPGTLAGRSGAELIGLCRTWNPALRQAAIQELVTRGDAIRPTIREMLSSEDLPTRRIGALVTLGLSLIHI